MGSDLAYRRGHKSDGKLNRSELPDGPFELFRRWFEDARRSEISEPNAMTLATSTADGKPSSRIVLLKDVDTRGFVFYTNLESRKAREILDNPRAVLTFWWPPLHRQVRIEGSVEAVSEEVADTYFTTRSRGSRLGAWASPQSQEIPNRKTLEDRFAEVEKRHSDDEIPRPPFWGGFRVVPEAIEFWQGRPNRLHDRFLYRRGVDGEWVISRLAP